jgi:hypothetical protein
MGQLLVSGISYFVQDALLTPLQQFLFSLLSNLAAQGLTIAQLPFVVQVTQSMAAVAATLLVTRVAWEGLSRYVLWNEGTGDGTGGELVKGVLRTAFFMGLGSFLAIWVFRFGLDLAGVVGAAPLASATRLTSSWVQDVVQAPNVAVGTVLFLLLFILAVVGGLLVVTIQTAIRAAELTFLVVAGPLMALGQLYPDGGVWNSWWRQLVTLSVAQAWQFFGLKAMVSVSQVVLDGSPAASLSNNLIDQVFVAVLMSLAFIIVTVRGPHLIKEWAAHTGIGGGIVFATQRSASYASQQAAQRWLSR